MQTTNISRLSITCQIPEIQFQERQTRPLLSPSLEYGGTKKWNIPNYDKLHKYKAQTSMNNLKGETWGEQRTEKGLLINTSALDTSIYIFFSFTQTSTLMCTSGFSTSYSGIEYYKTYTLISAS